MSPGAAFFLIRRSRRTYFRRQSLALYRRYAHGASVLLALFGVLLVNEAAPRASDPAPWR